MTRLTIVIMEKTHWQWEHAEPDVWRVDRDEGCGYNVLFLLKTFLASHHDKRSNTPASNTSTPRECTLTPKGLQDQWTGMSVYALIHAVHASVGKLTTRFSHESPSTHHLPVCLQTHCHTADTLRFRKSLTRDAMEDGQRTCDAEGHFPPDRLHT